MPTYEYRCKDCAHEFEAVQSFTEESLTECPSCSGSLRKVFGNVGITFKGSGFYKTDSRASSSGDRSDTKGDGDGGSSKDSSKTDSGSADTKVSSADSGKSGSDSSNGTTKDKDKGGKGNHKKADAPTKPREAKTGS